MHGASLDIVKTHGGRYPARENLLTMLIKPAIAAAIIRYPFADMGNRLWFILRLVSHVRAITAHRHSVAIYRRNLIGAFIGVIAKSIA